MLTTLKNVLLTLAACDQFQLLTREELLESLQDSEWKPDSALGELYLTLRFVAPSQIPPVEAAALIVTKEWPSGKAGQQFMQAFENFKNRGFEYRDIVKPMSQ